MGKKIHVGKHEQEKWERQEWDRHLACHFPVGRLEAYPTGAISESPGGTSPRSCASPPSFSKTP